MKRLLLILAVALLFGFTAAAQTATESAKGAKKAKAATTATAEAPKSHTMTGCIGGSAGKYTITNGRYKNGVAVAGKDDLAAHVGHTVKLTGTWSEDKKTFNETKVDLVKDSCAAAPAAAPKGEAKAAPKGEKKGTTPPK